MTTATRTKTNVLGELIAREDHWQAASDEASRLGTEYGVRSQRLEALQDERGDHPICGYPEGCIAEASHVHHLDGEGPIGERGLDPSNLLALCPSHHGVIEAAARRRGDEGKWVGSGT